MAKSMEEFGPVALDYFVQRRVEKVRKTRSAKRGNGFVIVFEGGGEIHNFDQKTPAPEAIVGAALTRVDLSSKKTVLYFGLEQVVINPMEHAIRDPNYTKGELVYPQRSRFNMPPEPPEEPEGRVAEGPDQEWIDAQEEPASE